MSHPVHNYHVPTWALMLFRQQATAAERPTQAQLEQLVQQINQNVEFQSLVSQGKAQPFTVTSADQIINRVRQNNFGQDKGESRGDREARLAQRNENGLIDWVVTQLDENFSDNREAFKRNGEYFVTLDAVMTEVQGERGVKNLRYQMYPEAMVKLLENIISGIPQVDAAVAAA